MSGVADMPQSLVSSVLVPKPVFATESQLADSFAASSLKAHTHARTVAQQQLCAR